MSKASEWAKASAVLSKMELRPFVADAMRPITDPPGGTIRIHVSVGRQGDQPVLAWTDHRLGGVLLSAPGAVSLARWILDTFGEEAT